MCQMSGDSMTMRFDAWQASILGTREEQQDVVLLEKDRDHLLAAICDGMGGLTNGRQASITAIETLRTLHRSKPENESYYDFFLRAVDVLDESVCALRRLNNEQIISGTTIVSVAITKDQLFWLSIGDSRLYLIRNNEIVCVTTDHNYFLLLNRAYNAGEISELEYEIEKGKGEALISYIGMGGIELMDMNSKPFVLQPEDVIILMSDGLYRCVSSEEMLDISISADNVQEIAERLIERSQVNANGIQDNTSIIVIKVNGELIL